MTVFERIKKLTKERSKTMKQVTLDLGYSENYFYSLKSGKQPSADKLNELADYFNVSVDYLLGREEKVTSVDLSEDDVVFSFDGKEVSPEEIRAAIAVIKAARGE